MALYQQYPSNLSFCTNKLHKASINSEHLSNPKPVFYLVHFSAQVQKIEKNKRNPTLKKILMFFQKKVFLIHQNGTF